MQKILKNLDLVFNSESRNIDLSNICYEKRNFVTLLREDISFDGLSKELSLLLYDEEMISLINNIDFSFEEFKFLLSTSNENYDKRELVKVLKETLIIENFSIYLSKIYEFLYDYEAFNERPFLICNIIKYLDNHNIYKNYMLSDMIHLYMNISNGKISKNKTISNLSNEYKIRISFSLFIYGILKNNISLDRLLTIIPYVKISEFDDLDFLAKFLGNDKLLILFFGLYFDLNDEDKKDLINDLRNMTIIEKEKCLSLLTNLSTKINRLSMLEYKILISIVKENIYIENIFEYIYKNHNILFEHNFKKYQIDFLKQHLNKKGFLKLVNNNIDIFLSLPEDNVIFKVESNSFLNLNTLNEKNLKTLLTLTNNDEIINLDLLSKFDNLTFNEFHFLVTKDIYMVKLFYKLYSLDLKIDYRLKVIKQLPNLKLFFNKWKMKDEDIENYLEKLSLSLIEKPFKDRINLLKENYKNLTEIKNEDFLIIVLEYDIFNSFLKEIYNSNDIYYIYKFHKEINGDTSLENFKKEKLKKDFYYQYLVNELNLSKEFLNKNSSRIIGFCERKLHKVFYYFMNNDNQGPLQLENMKKIVKYELLGKIDEIKFVDKDFNLEIGLEISNKMKKIWKQNIHLNGKKYSIRETFNFEHIIRLGEYPVNTCQHWDGGEYSKCLLSNFDTNKKIIISTYNKKINARALIRLTKGSFDEISNKLTFVDFKNKKDLKKDKEEVVLFLEKTYSGLDKSQLLIVKKQVIELAKNKAKELNVPLVVSNFYSDVLENEKLVDYNLFISYSKNGCQYLDSLDGQAEEIEEGMYKPCSVYIL